MSEIINRDRMHVQDESVHAHHVETPEEEKQEDYEAIRVHVTDTVATTTAHTQFGAYATYVIPASSATVPSVVQILPHDPYREYAYIQAVDAPIVIATTYEEAQSPANVGAALPAGGYASGGWTPPIRHNEAVWAANTSTTLACRVTVLVERGAPN